METESPVVEQYCRLCLKTNAPYLSLFENDTDEMLESLTAIRVSPEDPGPNLTCFKCFVELRCAFETQQKLIDNEALLQEKILNNNKTKNGIEKCINQLQASESPIKYEDETSTSMTKAEPEEILSEIDNLVSENQTIYSCNSCPMECNTYAKYTQHLKVHAKRRCLMCPRMIPADKIKEHHQTHEDGFCEYCGRRLKHSGSLRKHVNNWHREPKITCKECGDILNNKRAYDLHVRRIHTKDPTFMCDLCGSKFFVLALLNRHIRHKHSDEKPFSCRACNKNFTTKFNLKTHQLEKHTSKESFICELCGKGFKVKYKLNIHTKNAHGSLVEKKFQCSSCDSCFATKFALTIHISKKHYDKQ